MRRWVALSSVAFVLCGCALTATQAGADPATTTDGTGPSTTATTPSLMIPVALQSLRARVSGRSVDVRYVLNEGASVNLAVEAPRGGAVTVARRRNGARASIMVWNGKLRGRPVHSGRYTLVFTASVGGQSVRRSKTVKL